MIWVLSIGAGMLLGLAALLAMLYRREVVEREVFVSYTTAPPAAAPAIVPPLPPVDAAVDASDLPDVGGAPIIPLAETASDGPARMAKKARHPARRGQVGKVAAPATVTREELLVLAREAFNQRDYDNALAYGQQAVRLGGGAEAHALLGNTYFKLGRMEKAEQAFSEAVALDPGNELFSRRLRLLRDRSAGNVP